MKLAAFFCLFVFGAAAQTAKTCAASPTSAPASQTSPDWDISGNTLLSGTYTFRYLQMSVGDQQGNLRHAAIVYGAITFRDGAFDIGGTVLDSDTGQATALTPPSKRVYAISACGFGFLSDPLSGNDVLWVTVSAGGVITGSATETTSPFNNLFVAAPANPQAGNSALHGAYSVAYIHFPNGYVPNTATAGFQIVPDGAGHIGPVNILYQTGSSKPANVSEPAGYSLAQGTGQLSFPLYGAISGAKTLALSPEGNLIFGGGTDSFDFYIGVKTEAPNVDPSSVQAGFGAGTFGGLYYQAGLDDTLSGTGAALTGSLQTYYGALRAAAGVIVEHRRIVAPLRSPQQGTAVPAVQPAASPYQPFGLTLSGRYSIGFGFNTGYTDDTINRQYVFGAGGSARLGFGLSPNIGLSIALKAPATQSAPAAPALYIDPTGVVNAAGYAPYTSGIAPGELILVYGANFTKTTTVTVGTLPAVTTYIAADRLLVRVPAEVQGPTARIQAADGAAVSNLVWQLVNRSAPGVLTEFQNGLGNAVALHADQSYVTIASPATAGETIKVFTTGLGAYASTTFFGVPATPPNAQYTISVLAGSAPATLKAIEPYTSLAGVDVVTFTVPSGVTGTVPLVIVGPDGTSAQATLPLK